MQVEMNVKGMSCKGCAKGIVAALRFLPGVSDVDAKFEGGTVVVQYDPARVDLHTLKSEIEALDYEVVG